MTIACLDLESSGLIIFAYELINQITYKDATDTITSPTQSIPDDLCQLLYQAKA